MRFRHIFSETAAGLRQNLTMTLAVIMTMWVSLSLFGAGLLANQQVDLMKGDWYDKIEISIFLCTPDVQGDNCDPGQGATDAQKDLIRQTLVTNPEVAPEGVFFESKEDAYEEFTPDREHHPARDLRSSSRDRHHASGRREQPLYHAALSPGSTDLRRDRGGVGLRHTGLRCLLRHHA
jgi:cell division transport system permease protein